MLRWFWLFSLVSFGQVVSNSIVFWQIKNAKNLVIFGIKFPNLWAFWFGYSIILLPIGITVGVISSYAYWYGFNVVFAEKAWYVQLTVWLSSIMIMFLTAWLYLGELPAKNTVAALFFLVCALVAILWK